MLAGGAGEVREPAGELAARDLAGELAHGEQGGGGDVLFGHHLRGEHPYLMLLYLAVLVFTETVLQALEIPYGLVVNCRIIQRGEELQQVAQLLASLTQVMQALRR